MPPDEPRDVFLEIAPTNPGAGERVEPSVVRADDLATQPGVTPPVAPASTATTPGGSAYLEPEAPSGEVAPKRRKARAEDRKTAGADAVSLALVAALQTERPLMSALWPDVPPADLIRSPPPPEAFTARCDYTLRALDAVARRDAESRARADVAQRNLQRMVARAQAAGPSARDAALAELQRAQEDDLLDAIRVLAGPARALYPADLARLDAAAEARGLDGRRAREIARAAGHAVPDPEAGAWSPCEALPGAPATMDAAAEVLLQDPARCSEAVRSGAVLAWLRSNGAAPEVIARARDARQVAERSGAEALAAHSQAWGLGRREVALGAERLRAPTDIPAAVRGGKVTLDDLARSAREGVLGAWLRLHGWVVAAGAADLVARGEATGMKRLAWSLGEPLVLGDQGLGDPATLARTVLARPELRDALVGVFASGDLLAWLESLPPALRDEQWIDRLRRARAVPGGRGGSGGGGDPLALWSGIYTYAGTRTLVLTAGGGHAVTLTSADPLRITTQVAEVWDDLKRAYRTGELLAWLARVEPDFDLTSVVRPPRDEDAELNALLWDLGHAGLVMEWGAQDFVVTSPADLVRAWQASWQQLESQVAQGYVLTWLERFHGDRVVGPGGSAGGAGPGGDGPAGPRLRDLAARLRAELRRLPAGYAGLKVALLCGLRYLPLDPRDPRDPATFRGYSGVSGGTGRAAAGGRGMPGGAAALLTAWEPLRDHVTLGTALVWLAQLPGVRPQLAELLLHDAFRAPGAVRDEAEHTQRVMAGIAQTFGAPQPSPVLQAELDGALGRTSREPTPPVAVPGEVVPAVAVVRPRARRWVAPLALLLVVAGGFAAWWDVAAPFADSRPAALDGTEVWVRMEVRLRASRTNLGRPWDIDGSAPDLHATIETRGEAVEVGPCQNSYRCASVFENVRLSPNAPFRIALEDVDLIRNEAIGNALLLWHGGRREELQATVGACTVEVSITRQVPQPQPLPAHPAVPAPTSPTRPVPPAPRADPAGATTPAGRGRVRHGRGRDGGAVGPPMAPVGPSQGAPLSPEPLPEPPPMGTPGSF